uniref:Uncharacterized protein n=1 Tax=Athene cunicularia TaxID=194338 RepID=A0A663LVM3_ATHCN
SVVSCPFYGRLHVTVYSTHCWSCGVIVGVSGIDQVSPVERGSFSQVSPVERGSFSQVNPVERGSFSQVNPVERGSFSQCNRFFPQYQKSQMMASQSHIFQTSICGRSFWQGFAPG